MLLHATSYYKGLHCNKHERKTLSHLTFDPWTVHMSGLFSHVQSGWGYLHPQAQRVKIRSVWVLALAHTSQLWYHRRVAGLVVLWVFCVCASGESVL